MGIFLLVGAGVVNDISSLRVKLQIVYTEMTDLLNLTFKGP
jgi:hypothetical protein